MQHNNSISYKTLEELEMKELKNIQLNKILKK